MRRERARVFSLYSTGKRRRGGARKRTGRRVLPRLWPPGRWLYQHRFLHRRTLRPRPSHVNQRLNSRRRPALTLSSAGRRPMAPRRQRRQGRRRVMPCIRVRPAQVMRQRQPRQRQERPSRWPMWCLRAPPLVQLTTRRRRGGNAFLGSPVRSIIVMSPLLSFFLVFLRVDFSGYIVCFFSVFLERGALDLGFSFLNLFLYGWCCNSIYYHSCESFLKLSV